MLWAPGTPNQRTVQAIQLCLTEWASGLMFRLAHQAWLHRWIPVPDREGKDGAMPPLSQQPGLGAAHAGGLSSVERRAPSPGPRGRGKPVARQHGEQPEVGSRGLLPQQSLVARGCGEDPPRGIMTEKSQKDITWNSRSRESREQNGKSYNNLNIAWSQIGYFDPSNVK